MKRSIVHREVTVLLNLAPGEIPDMVKRFGSTPFAPETLSIKFATNDRDSEWRITNIVTAGPRRLKSGGTSTSGDVFTYDWWSAKDAPAWVMDAIRANTPAPVGDDLPIQHEHTADLPGGA